MDSSNEARFFTTIIHTWDSKALRPVGAPQHQKKRKRATEHDPGETSAASETEDQGYTSDDQYADDATDDLTAAYKDPFFYPFETSELHSTTTINIDDPEQSRTAGLDPDDPIPAFPFPHRSHTGRVTRDYLPKPKHLISILASLKPPVHVSSDHVRYMGRPTSMRGHHISVTMTLLLRSMQDGNWRRAEWAWGGLMRTHHSGYWLDARTNGLWGLGAEILLQRSTEFVHPPNAKPSAKRQRRARSADARSDGDDDDEDDDENDVRSEDRSDPEDDDRSRSESSSPPPQQQQLESDAENWRQPSEPAQKFFTADGFRRARAYYDHLIVQHPSVRTHQKGTLAPEFYPATMSLWVYEATELSRRRKWELDHSTIEQQSRGDEGYYDDMDGMMEDENEENEERELNHSDRKRKRQELQRAQKLAEIAAEDLRQAQLICSRLDELLLSPPYDTNAYLLELRGHVGLWISDLIVDSLPPPSTGDGDDGDDDDDEELRDPETAEARRDAQRAQAEELENAKEFFLRAQEAGGTLAASATEIIERPFYGSAATSTTGSGGDGGVSDDDAVTATSSSEGDENDSNTAHDVDIDE